MKEQRAKDMATGVHGYQRWSSGRKTNEQSLEVLREPRVQGSQASTRVGEDGSDQLVEI